MHPDTIHQKRILIAPLNWGLGHVMRIIPLIKKLQRQQNIIFVACDSQQQAVLQDELAHVTYISFAGYPFNFSGKSFAYDLIRRFWPLYRQLNNEHAAVNHLTQTHKFDLVISDQRPGFRSDKVPSIFLSHMLNLPLPFYLKPAQWIYVNWIQRFDSIWIPDVQGSPSLSGKLSHTSHRNAIYIGWLSRFEPMPQSVMPKYAYGAIVSGPEPYRTIFLEEVKLALRKLDKPCFLIGSVSQQEQVDQLTLFPHQATSQFHALVESAETIISRAGYSTLMDLRVLNKKAILVPTPGQHEQLWLREWLKTDEQFTFIDKIDELNAL